MAIISLKKAMAFLAAIGSTAVVSAQDEEQPLKVMFLNQFADTAIDLFWENHAFPDDHPDRRKLEARIAPRGGWHASETFFGHGEYTH